MSQTETHRKIMNEYSQNPRSNRTHLKADYRSSTFNAVAADNAADEQYFGKSYRKITVCPSCYLRHNGMCY